MITDSLREYRRKRSFERTAELSRSEPKTSKQPIFVVQRHEASALHYDFRLEVDGVLKSWAIPKGPPGETGARRLAVPTEDHPLEYASFAGTIPKGQYGAGKVEIWDHGTYRNLRESADETFSMEDALEEGKVEVFLEGHKLHGRYALIRMADDEEASWLMLKMNGTNAHGGLRS
jgi:DNA ligase D-like protein (predicted 3'-phosphoesterase)